MLVSYALYVYKNVKATFHGEVRKQGRWVETEVYFYLDNLEF